MCPWWPHEATTQAGKRPQWWWRPISIRSIWTTFLWELPSQVISHPSHSLSSAMIRSVIDSTSLLACQIWFCFPSIATLDTTGKHRCIHVLWHSVLTKIVHPNKRTFHLSIAFVPPFRFVAGLNSCGKILLVVLALAIPPGFYQLLPYQYIHLLVLLRLLCYPLLYFLFHLLLFYCADLPVLLFLLCQFLSSTYFRSNKVIYLCYSFRFHLCQQTHGPTGTWIFLRVDVGLWG
jgi:hypothetical protein